MTSWDPVQYLSVWKQWLQYSANPVPEAKITNVRFHTPCVRDKELAKVKLHSQAIRQQEGSNHSRRLVLWPRPLYTLDDPSLSKAPRWQLARIFLQEINPRHYSPPNQNSFLCYEYFTSGLVRWLMRRKAVWLRRSSSPGVACSGNFFFFFFLHILNPWQ